jgi:hypothetical protein
MRKSRALALGKTRWQSAAELMPRRRPVSGLGDLFAQNSCRAIFTVYSTHVPNRITRKSLKINNRGTLYSSQTRGASSLANLAISSCEAHRRKALRLVSRVGKS